LTQDAGIKNDSSHGRNGSQVFFYSLVRVSGIQDAGIQESGVRGGILVKVRGS